MPNDTNHTPKGTSADVPNVGPAPTPQPKLRDDVARVLPGIKLPERLHKDYRAQGDAPTTPAIAPDELEAQIAAANTSVTETVAPATPKPKEFDIPSVHTLKDDLHSLVQGQELSMVKAAALEAKKRSDRAAAEEAHAVARPEKRRTLYLLFVAIALGMIALGALVFLSMRFVRGGSSLTATSTAATTPSSIMFTEQSLVYSLSGLTSFDIKQQLASARSQDMRLGAIQRIVPIVGSGDETQPATTAEFLNAIGAHLPDGMERALSSEFLLGYHALSTKVPILVIPVTSYERAFAGMLLWEETLPDDMAPMFTATPIQTTLPDGTSKARAFEDVTIQNYDIRVVRDAAGEIKLLYTFPTRSILIIAENPISLNEILARLRAERRL